MTKQFLLALLGCIVLLMTSDGAIVTTTCGTEKGCFKSPNECTGSDCEMIVTWRKVDDAVEFEQRGESDGTVEFELRGKSDGWVAIGFSDDSIMGGDTVLECIVDNNVVKAQISYNDGKSNIVIGTTGISKAQGEYKDGYIECSFTMTIENSNDKVVNLFNAYTLMLGRGPASGGSKRKHVLTPIVSSNKIKVTQFTGSKGGVASRPLLRAHGILMMSAWTLFVCTAILLARYYKNAWPGKKLCSKPIWFSVHQFLNSAVLIMTVIAFILIFVDVKGYTSNSTWQLTAHPIAGIIVTILVILNPVMAIFRPAPDAEKRFIFNWLHWGVGSIAYTLSVFTIYLGMSIARSFIDPWVKFVLIGFTVFYIIIVFILEILRCQAAKSSDELEMSSPGAPNEQKFQQPRFAVSQYIIFFVFVTGGLVFYLIMLIAMATG